MGEAVPSAHWTQPCREMSAITLRRLVRVAGIWEEGRWVSPRGGDALLSPWLIDITGLCEPWVWPDVFSISLSVKQHTNDGL